MFRVAGEEEDLVVRRKGSDGLHGGSAAGAVHVGEGVVEEEEAGHVLEVEFEEGQERGEAKRSSTRRSGAISG